MSKLSINNGDFELNIQSFKETLEPEGLRQGKKYSKVIFVELDPSEIKATLLDTIINYFNNNQIDSFKIINNNDNVIWSSNQVIGLYDAAVEYIPEDGSDIPTATLQLLSKE